MDLVVDPSGVVRLVYAEDLELRVLGRPVITRASHVEPTPDGKWTADLSPLKGPVLGPFEKRGEALAAEVAWLDAHWLCRSN
jgi:hypothetical protein